MSEKPAPAREAVLESAIAAFARKGYAGTSVQDILRATGLSKPTLYYYFENKAGLFRAILDFAYDESFCLMRELVARVGDCDQRLVAVATAIFQFAERHQNLTRLVFATVFAAPEEIPKGCIDLTKRRRNYEFVLAMVRAGQKEGTITSEYNAEEVTHGIFGAISHQVRTHLLMPKGKLDRQRAERVVALFFDGARPKN
jgi:AcrR family transcriptional regulator